MYRSTAKLPRLFPTLCTALLLLACSAPLQSAPASPSAAAFAGYWYQGQAEITSYTLEQARYGEIHQGDVALIFVTEDFSRRKHVKLDNPAAAGDDRVKILKLNANKRFTTGVYPYSMMSSVFTPVDHQADPGPLKVTATSQEWCGHTFTQLNQTAAGYKIALHSYFESEGDKVVELADAMPEDGLWTLLRLDPTALPTGRVRLIPGTLYQRLSHKTWAVHEAEATLAPDGDDAALMTYTLRYPDLDRTLTIRFRAAFPFEIESWEETHPSGRAGLLTTRAVKKERILLDYWNHHDLADLPWRDKLGME